MPAPIYPPGVEPAYPPELEPGFEDRPFTPPPRRIARSDGTSWIAVIVTLFVVIGLVYWFAGRPHSWNTASNTTVTTSQNPPATQPMGSQPPAAQPPASSARTASMVSASAALLSGR